MYASSRLSAPVLTFLTQSPQHSKLAQRVLKSYFQVKNVTLDNGIISRGGKDDRSDAMDEIFSFPLPKQGWHSSLSSTTSACSSHCDDGEMSDTSVFFHFLSLENNRDSCASDEEGLKNRHVSLIAITDTDGIDCKNVEGGMRSSVSTHPHADVIKKTRDLIASHIINRGNFAWNAINILSSRHFGKEIKGSHVTGLQDGLPILYLPTVDTGASTSNSASHIFSVGLREVVLPFFDDAKYPDGTTLLSALSKLPSPKTGLYQWPSSIVNQSQSGLILRPLPVGVVDMFIPPPTLVFNCKTLDDPLHSMEHDDTVQTSLHLVGRNSNSPGQMIVNQEHVKGLDLRFCEAAKLSSSFAEAQDSLFAGSIADLQNVNVLVKGGNVKAEKEKNSNEAESQERNTASNRVDAMNGLGDCWVEFRANMRNPRGFFIGGKAMKTWSPSSNKSVKKVAKAPDLPYE